MTYTLRGPRACMTHVEIVKVTAGPSATASSEYTQTLKSGTAVADIANLGAFVDMTWKGGVEGMWPSTSQHPHH